jgi:hypothetical protein
MHEDPEGTDRMAKNAAVFIRRYQWDTQKSIYLDLVDSLTQSSKNMSAWISPPSL